MHVEGIFVTDELGNFIAGVELFSAPPYLLAEDLCTNPSTPIRLRHAAVELIAGQALVVAIARCAYLRMIVRSKGLRMLLKRCGFKTQAALPMFYAPAELRFPQHPQKRTPRGHDSPGRPVEKRISQLDPSITTVTEVAEPVKTPRRPRQNRRAQNGQQRKTTQ
jgi:hypothetical protein